MAEPEQRDIVRTAPDGTEVAFPAGTDEQTIVQAMRKRFPEQQDIVMTAPDGTEVTFPAGTDRQTIVQAMLKRFPPQASQNPLGQGLATGVAEMRIRQALDKPDPAVRGGEVGFSPQFMTSPLNPAPYRAGAGMFLTSDPQAQADIIQRSYPDVERGVDRAGRPIVRRPGGEWVYVNAPGFSVQDVSNFASETARFGLAALPAGRVPGLAARSLTTGGTAAATQLASDAGAVGLGSQQGVSLPNAMLAGVAGAGGEVLGAALSPALRPRANPAAGVSGPGFVQSFLDLASPSAAGQRAEDAVSRNPNVNAPFGVPLTRGQITGEGAQIAFEQAAARGGRGEPAEQVMRPFMREQAQAVAAAGRQLAGPRTIPTDNPLGTAAEAGERVRQGLMTAEQAADDAVRGAYEQARGFNASIAGQQFSALRRQLYDALPDDIRAAEEAGLLAGRQQRAPARDILTDVDNIIARSQAAIEGGANAAEVSFRAIEAMRGALETQRRALAARPGNETAAMLLARQKTALDTWINDAVELGLWSGDPGFLAAFRQARQARRQFAQRFEAQPDQMAQRAVRQIIDRDMNAGSVVDVIFGAGQNISNRYARTVTENVVNILGRESAEVQALREVFVDRVIGPLQSQDILQPARIAKGLREALEGNQAETLEVLFSPEELTQMSRFADLLDRLTPPTGTVNTSNSATDFFRVMGGTLGRMASNPFAQILLNRVESLTGGAMNAARAQAAIQGARSTALAPRLAVALAPPVALGTNREGLERQRLDELARLQAQGAAAAATMPLGGQSAGVATQPPPPR